jgi:4-amino-4-deoxy-L-arabinose transferase-like glycosyltransferase
MTLGTALRIYHLGFKSLWLDEAVLYWIANGDLEHIIAQNASRNSAPPLFALLLGGVMRIGSSEEALRAISCLTGIATIPMIYLLARQFVPGRFAYFASLLVAISPNQIKYAQQVREYSLTFLLAICLFLLFYHFLQGPSWPRSLFLGLLMSVAVFTQYGLALLIVSLNLVFAVTVYRFDEKRTCLAMWIVAQFMALLAAYGVFHLALQHQFTPGGFGVSYLHEGYWNGSLGSLFNLLTVNTKNVFEFAFPVTGLMLFLCGLGVLATIKHDETSIGLVLFVLPFFVIFVSAMFRIYPYLGGRQTIFLGPMIYVFAAVGVAWLSSQIDQRTVVVCLIVVVCTGYGLKRTTDYLNIKSLENIRPIVTTLKASANREDIVYVHHGAIAAFRYYFRGNDLPWIRGIHCPSKPDRCISQLERIVGGKQRIWMVFSHVIGNERRQLVENASANRGVKLIREDAQAWLYLAD